MARRPLKNPKIAAYDRAWRAKNRAHLTAYAKKHRQKNRERYAENARRWRAKNRDKMNTRRHETRLIAGLITPAQYDAMLVMQHGVCAIVAAPLKKDQLLAIRVADSSV